jgi:hypothetical protein
MVDYLLASLEGIGRIAFYEPLYTPKWLEGIAGSRRRRLCHIPKSSTSFVMVSAVKPACMRVIT